ncbi:UPF0481 protein At3g47200-like isoform X1 [Triticum urartu]|uniref:UPF0481 protein At3g47200-like isoform X1 n=1 Tax=Triticum urartu TaxID=4572 RepID=UPI0020433025|nr:UPF0481 protein At3g47200-like isoform X1 [Triticum urartu]
MASRRRVEESVWVADVDAALSGHDPSTESAQWQWHCIYRVPACIKHLNLKAYQPQVVSLGPFHHGEPHLLPMDVHKRRSLLHLLRRARKPLSEFVVAVAGVAEQLEGAYQGLADDWRGALGCEEERRERFLEMMVTDGCFLLEVMRTASGFEVNDYAPNDPVFSNHGLLYTVPYIRRDMIMIENQLPLLVLHKLLAVETGKDEQNEELINRMVQRFLTPAAWPPATGVGLALHPLDILRRSLLYGPTQTAPPAPPDYAVPDDIIRSAEELYEAGVRFKRSRTSSLLDISFHRGVLRLPAIVVDDTTEYMLLNLMAFERLHAGAGNEVTAYVFFMDNMIDTAADVALLTCRRIVHNTVGSDKAVAKLFSGMSRDVVLEPQSALDDVHRQVNAYCRKRWNRWRANLVHTYFKSPWSFLSLAAAVFLLGMTIMQTVYTVLQFYQDATTS